VKRVATTKAGAETVVGNPPVGCRRLCLSSLLLRRSGRLLGALRLLRRSGRLLGALRLLCRSGRLLGALRLLCRSRLLLRRSGLLLRRFRLLLPLLRLLLLFAWSIRVSGSNGSGNQ
jgi:hypothetical protein